MAIKVSKIISINELNNNEPSAESLVLLRKNDVDGYSTVQQLEDYFSFVKQDEYQEKVSELEAADNTIQGNISSLDDRTTANTNAIQSIQSGMVAATTSKSGLMSATDKAKLDDIQTQANKTTATSDSAGFTTENSNNNTLSNTEAVAKTTAYDIGSITPGAGDNPVAFKGKDTTYGKATDTKYGLVKLGSNTQLSSITNASNSPDTSKVYPVQATSDGKLGVYVPWKNDQALPETNDDIFVDTSSLQELMFFYKQPLRSEANGSGGFNWVENGDGSYIVASSMPTDSPNPTKAGETGYRYGDAGTEKYIFPIINLPSSVVFAELQIISAGFGVPLPVSIPLSKDGNGRNVIDTTKYASMQFTGFDSSSIKSGKPAYAYLRFTTEAHTYNATVRIDFIKGKGGKADSYIADIII